MRFYVYALIDPTRNNAPFYIGKGLDNRLQCHFTAATKLGNKNQAEVVGCDTHSVLEDATADRVTERLSRIAELRNQGFDHTRIARIIARRLDENTALTVEAFLIRSIYSVRGLTNRVEGTHAERFRDCGTDGFIGGFDMDVGITDVQLREIEKQFGRYYVYTLRDPITRHVFLCRQGNGQTDVRTLCCC